MNRSGLRLALSKALKVHRGEESRILGFFLLQFLLSVVIGMINTVVDPLFIKHNISELSFLHYGFSALLLGVIGLAYAGVTDRFDKRRLFSRALVISSGICLIGSLLLFLQDYVVEIPFLYSGLFVWRFVVGILLLMVFWDLTPFYFDARQGKRLFPLLAVGGAAGYSAGSILVAPLSRVLPFGAQFLLLSVFSLSCFFLFRSIRRTFPILDSPRYKEMSVVSEVKEGVSSFYGNSFLRAVGVNTFVFGLLSGFIIFTYNAVVNARALTGADAAGLMGLQRAGATVVQAVVLTKVMSQSALGGRHKKELAAQLFFFVLGIFAFAVSMVGVADFTRQIEIALMSPAAIAAFAFLPSRYRGRVMVLNNLVVAPLGILAASIFVSLIGPHVRPLWFIYPIGMLMAVRLGFNFVLNRRYMLLLSDSILHENRLDLARIEENTGSILKDDGLLAGLLGAAQKQSLSIRMFLASRLAKSAETLEDLRRIEPFFHDPSPALKALRIETLARIGFEEFRHEILEGTASSFREVRTVSHLAVLRHLVRTGGEEEFAMRISALVENLRRGVKEDSSEAFGETVEILLPLEAETGRKLFELDWNGLKVTQQRDFLLCLANNPNVAYFPLLAEQLGNADLAQPALAGLKHMPESLLTANRETWKDFPPGAKLRILKELVSGHPLFTREESVSLLRTLFKDRLGEEKHPSESLEILYRSGKEVTETAILIVSDAEPAPPELCRSLEKEIPNLVALYPHLFMLFLNTSGLEKKKYYPLMRKLVDEELRLLSLMVLSLSSIVLRKEEDRNLAFSICRELADRTDTVRQNALEFIETKTGGDAKHYLLLYFEKLSPEEKRIRLRPVLKKFPKGYKQVLTEWRRFFASVGDELAEEIFAGLIDGD